MSLAVIMSLTYTYIHSYAIEFKLRPNVHKFSGLHSRGYYKFVRDERVCLSRKLHIICLTRLSQQPNIDFLHKSKRMHMEISKVCCDSFDAVQYQLNPCHFAIPCKVNIFSLHWYILAELKWAYSIQSVHVTDQAMDVAWLAAPSTFWIQISLWRLVRRKGCCNKQVRVSDGRK